MIDQRELIKWFLSVDNRVLEIYSRETLKIIVKIEKWKN
jgi:hypothetical protein